MRLVLWLLSLIPLPVLHPLGAALGRLAWVLSPRFRRLMTENLANAGYDVQKMAPEVSRQLGMQAIESGWIWAKPHAWLMDRVTVTPEAERIVTEALASGRPVLFMTPHIGCYEITPVWLAQRHLASTGRYIAILYRVPKKAILRSIVSTGRETPGVKPAPADLKGVRMLLRAMKTGEIVGVLPDQAPSMGEGVWADFFGKKAYTMTLPLRLAKQFDAIRIVAWGRRIPGRGWEIGARLWDDPLTGDFEHDARSMNSALEGVIRELPEQYLWSYNRYKCPQGARRP